MKSIKNDLSLDKLDELLNKWIETKAQKDSELVRNNSQNQKEFFLFKLRTDPHTLVEKQDFYKPLNVYYRLLNRNDNKELFTFIEETYIPAMKEYLNQKNGTQ